VRSTHPSNLKYWLSLHLVVLWKRSVKAQNRMWQVRCFPAAEVQVGWIAEDYAKVDIAGVGLSSQKQSNQRQKSASCRPGDNPYNDGTAHNYNIEVALLFRQRCRNPYASSPVPLKLAELEALRPDLTAYSAALSKQLYAQRLSMIYQARAGSSARSWCSTPTAIID